MSELITNSAHHAFGDNGGVIRVELLPSASIIECRVTDNGTGKPRTRSGNGMNIIASLAKSLGGAIDQRFGPEGATAVLIFPAEWAPFEHLDA